MKITALSQYIDHIAEYNHYKNTNQTAHVANADLQEFRYNHYPQNTKNKFILQCLCSLEKGYIKKKKM